MFNHWTFLLTAGLVVCVRGFSLDLGEFDNKS